MFTGYVDRSIEQAACCAGISSTATGIVGFETRVLCAIWNATR